MDSNKPLKESKPVTTVVKIPPNLSFSQYQCSNPYCENYSLLIENTTYQKKIDESVVFKKQLTTKQQRELMILVAELKLTSLNTSVKPGEPACIVYSSDSASYLLKLMKGRFSQTLDIYAGCKEVPVQYLNLIEWFKTIAGGKASVSNF